jgi:hypothetical protein
MNKRRLLLILTLPTLLLVALILSDALPGLRGPAPGTAEWYWPYRLRPPARWPAPLLAALFLLALGGRWLGRKRPCRRADILALCGLSLAILLLQLALIYADRPAVLAEMIDRTQSDLASGFFMPAAEIDDLAATLRDYPAVMPVFAAEHARTHPPGLIIANHETIRLLEEFPVLSRRLARRVYPRRCIDLWLLNRPHAVAAALFIWSWLPLLAAAAVVWPGYALARAWLSPRPARFAVLLMATIPALLLFAPKVVAFYPPLVLLLFWALHRGIKRRAPGRLFLAGLLASLATFLSLGNAALALPVGIYALLMLWQERRWTIRAAGETAVPLLIGGLAIWLGYWALFAVPPWRIVQVGLGQHYELVTQHRRYDWWLLWNLVDLLVYAGWPLLLGFGLTLWRSGRALRRRELKPVAALALALAALILALDLSGSARGEVGRLWLFFMPLLALAAGAALARRLARRGLLLVLALQLALTVSVGVAWRPVRAVNVAAERPEMGETAVPLNETSLTFRESPGETVPIHLRGYVLPDDAFTPGETIPLTLVWEARGATLRPYTVFTQLLNAGDEIVAQQDNWPVQGQWPPTCWEAGERIVDPYNLALPPDLAPGDYRLIVGLYDAADGARLQTENGRDAVLLQTIRVSR